MRLAELRERDAGDVFLASRTGGYMSPSTGRNHWLRFLAANPDAPQVTVENLRHSFATAYLAAGGRVETLSRILGHADVSTTLRRYVRPDASALAEDMRGLDLPPSMWP